MQMSLTGSKARGKKKKQRREVEKVYLVPFVYKANS